MKFAALFVLPMVLFAFTTTQAADKEEKVEIKSKDDGKKFEMKVKRKGNDYVGVRENKEYVLKGEAVTSIKNEGDYVFYGTPSDDQKFFEVRRVEPVVVEERTRIENPVKVKVEEKPIKREEKYEEKIEIK